MRGVGLFCNQKKNRCEVQILNPKSRETHRMSRKLFNTGPVTALSGPEAIRDVYAHNRNVFLVISRKYNGNLVVLEAILNDRREITDIEMFWLDVDPAYVQVARKNGRLHDREELTSLDLVAYGFDLVNKINPTQWVIHFRKYPKKDLLISVTETGTSSFSKKNGEMYKLFSFHIFDTTVLGVLPTVEYVEIISYNVKTKQKHVDKIVP